jgi:hypothetical protein
MPPGEQKYFKKIKLEKKDLKESNKIQDFSKSLHVLCDL